MRHSLCIVMMIQPWYGHCNQLYTTPHVCNVVQIIIYMALNFHHAHLQGGHINFVHHGALDTAIHQLGLTPFAINGS